MKSAWGNLVKCVACTATNGVKSWSDVGDKLAINFLHIQIISADICQVSRLSIKGSFTIVKIFSIVQRVLIIRPPSPLPKLVH